MLRRPVELAAEGSRWCSVRSNVRVGSTPDSRSLPLPRLLSGVKRTKSAHPSKCPGLAISGHSSASSQSAWRKSETGLAGLQFRHASAAKAFEDAFKAWAQPGMAVAKFFNCVSLPAGQFHVLAENYAGVIRAAKHGKRRR